MSTQKQEAPTAFESTSSKSGAVLVLLVLVLIALVSLGVASITTTAGAMRSRIIVGDAMRAYYLAESGVEYAKSMRRHDPDLLPNGTMTVGNGDQFEVTTVAMSNGVHLVSVGVVNPGALLETRRRITFLLFEQNGNESLPLSFDFDEDGEFDEDVWDLVGLTKADIVETGPSGGESALDLKGTEGSIELNWQDTPELDLGASWLNNDSQLDYEIQMKISPFDTGNEQAFSHHYMLGLSFRLDPEEGTSYGVSVFHSRTHTANGREDDPPDWMHGVFDPLRGTNLYLVIWYRNGEEFTLLNSHLLDESSGVATNIGGTYMLRDYSTILVGIDEQVDPESGERENHIAAYIQNTDVYPNWDSAADIRWSTDRDIFPGPVLWDGPPP